MKLHVLKLIILLHKIFSLTYRDANDEDVTGALCTKPGQLSCLVSKIKTRTTW